LRPALGASRGRLVRQSLAESGVVAAAGGALGLALAYGGVRLLVALAPPGIPRLDAVGVDRVALAFALGATLLAGLAFGVAPALASSRANVSASLREGSRGAADGVRRRRVRGALVVSEFAMALVLLVGAGLVLRSFAALLAVDPGFDARNVLSMQVSLRGTASGDPARRTVFFRELLDRVRALPGVETASAINHLPLHGDAWNFPFAIEGRPLAAPGRGDDAMFRVVRPDYFRTMRIPILAGRDITPREAASGAKVVVINEHMARTHWKGESPLGRRITVDDPAKSPDWYTVVGVVKEARRSSWSEEGDEEMYFPNAPSSLPEGTMRLAAFLNPAYLTLVVRTTTDPASLALAVERVVREMERDAPVSDVITMPQAVAEQLAGPRFYLLLLGTFAAVALALAAVGVYGVISYATARRTREIGVRLALGAGRGDSVRLVVGQGVRLAALGTGIGLVAALLAVRYLRALLYGVQPTDPVTFAAVTALLAGVAVAACAVPAWRASRTDPVVALRAE
jgi:putative ABC transport system permease protein